MTLQKHADQVRQNPLQWLPWNYQQTFPTSETG